MCNNYDLPFLRWEELSCLSGSTADIAVVRLNPETAVRNTVIYNNPQILPLSLGVETLNSASDVELIGTNNILLTSSPFVSEFKIDSTSVLYNAGTLIGLRESDTLDLAYNPRVNGDTIDIGAFEYPAYSSLLPALILLTFNDVEISLNSTEMNYTVHFPCEVSTATLYVEARTGNIISVNGQNVSNPGNFFVNAGTAGSKQTLNIVVTSNSGDSNVTYTVEVFTPFSNNLLHQTFRTMLEVVNNPAYNGGYTFTDNGYTWYINDVRQAEQSGILNLPNGLQSGAAYSVWITYASTGEQNKICPLIAPIQAPPSLNVYPNPTSNEIIVEIPTEIIVEDKPIELYSGNGTLLRTFLTTGDKTNINLQHLPVGRYIIRYNNLSTQIIKQ